MKLNRQELSATIYCLEFTLLADKGDMTQDFKIDIQNSLDKLNIEAQKQNEN
jgi:hypothetical protein